jgi:geranylgeranyl diphosphate synthase type I
VAHGINAGDGLFVLARLALHRLTEQDVPLDRQLRATLVLDRACLALCEGQYMDMIFEERRTVNLEQYLWMIQNKTAALLAASAEIGAIVATDGEAPSSAALIEHYRCFGENMGMAFQIQDDILGTWGDEQMTGKSTATDIRDKKKTLPVVYALNHPEDRQAAEELAGLYDSDEPLDEDGIRVALEILERLGSRQHAEQVAETYHRRALDSLAQCEPQATSMQPASSTAQELAWQHLRELAASLMGRSV